MFAYIWPFLLIVLANVLYSICTKSLPSQANPLASLVVTYLTAAVVTTGLYFVTSKGGNLIAEFKHLNWTAPALGVAIIMLEGGFIYAYKAGWPISTLFIVMSAFVAMILLLVGYFMYHEAINLKKLIGIAVCLLGLYIINR